MPEQIKPLPLSGDEVTEAVLYKIAESMEKSCNLRATDAYSAFKAEISIKLTLIDFGREQGDNHIVSAESGEIPEGTPVTTEINLQIDPEPVNKTRAETNQPVPVQVNEEGKTVIRRVKYQARKSKASAKSAAKK